jgi:3-hydroxyisobutyrate dehydrogenase-like beta-hydroxyacid dehydrogenase
MKLAVNLNLAIQMQGLCEGLILAEKVGVDRRVALEVFLSSAVASPMIQYRGPFILQVVLFQKFHPQQ